MARELRHNGEVTISCLQNETSLVLEQLGSFSHSSPIMTKSTIKPNSREVFLEIADTV